jgi:hypothetical protein
VPFPRARDVPFCGAISGLVFLALFMNLGEPIHLVYVLAGYGVVYFVEWYVRARRLGGVSETLRGDRSRA